MERPEATPGGRRGTVPDDPTLTEGDRDAAPERPADDVVALAAEAGRHR